MTQFRKYNIPKPDPKNQKEKDLFSVINQLILDLDSIFNNRVLISEYDATFLRLDSSNDMTSTDIINSLNADLLDGSHSSAFATTSHTHSTYVLLDGSVPVTKLTIDDALTYIDKDGSGNMTFTDAVTGSRTLKQLGCPTYKKLIATGLSAGEHNLTYASWGISKAWLKRLTITLTSGTSTDFDVAIYEKYSFLEADRIYNLEGNSGSIDIIMDYIYEDQDATDELHIKITDNDGSGTPVFGIELRGIELL